jgi:hypothetical protein
MVILRTGNMTHDGCADHPAVPRPPLEAAAHQPAGVRPLKPRSFPWVVPCARLVAITNHETENYKYVYMFRLEIRRFLFRSDTI